MFSLAMDTTVVRRLDSFLSFLVVFADSQVILCLEQPTMHVFFCFVSLEINYIVICYIFQHKILATAVGHRQVY